MMNIETCGDLLESDLGKKLLLARRTDAWDAIVTLLATLDAEHNQDFHAVMRGCRRLSNSSPEVDGLDDLLRAPEQHLHGVEIERERRRSQHGYATPADARAFLHMARQPQHESHRPIAIHPIAAPYFRAAEEEADTPRERTLASAPERALRHDASDVSAREDDEISTSIETVIELLAEAGVMPERPRALLGAADGNAGAARCPLLRRLMEFVRRYDEPAYLARGREMAFLANTLIAGSSVQSRPFTPGEASDAAASVCNLGLECWPSRWPLRGSLRQELDTAAPDAFLVDHDLVAAFEVGWSVLYQDVSLFAVDQLISMLADIHRVDTDTRNELHLLQRKLVEQREAGTPWLARDAADVLAMLDMTAWIGVLGLLDECPIVPAALSAVLEGRTTSVSPIAFEFISTSAQIGNVRVFMSMLPGLLTP
jgi:hypothetical protein